MNFDSYSVSYGHWSFDVKRKILYVDGNSVHLQRGVLNLLLFLVRREGEIVSKEELIDTVWSGRAVSDAAIYNRVGALRKALRDDQGPERCIQWEYGNGIRFARPQARSQAQHDLTEWRRPGVLVPDLTTEDRAAEPDPKSGPWTGTNPVSRWSHLLGAYHTLYRTPSWPNAIKIGLSVLRQVGDDVVVWTSERGEDTKFDIRQRARYRGSAAFIDGRVYVTEQNCRPPRSVCISTLDAPHVYRPNIMTGLMHGSSWRLGGAPYATRVVWRRVPDDMSLRDALEASGPVPEDTDLIDPTILKSIGTQCLTFHGFDDKL